jgi:HEAT repeat protein/beta-lactamase regulating signal transducer with metallopeptidase domain
MLQNLALPESFWLPALDALLKATLLLSIAGLATTALTRTSAAVRHLVWTLALAGALFLPILSIALPRWQLPLVTFAAPAQPAPNAALDFGPAPTAPPRAHRAERQEPIASVRSDAPAAAAVIPSASLLAKMSPMMWILAIWAVGAAFVVGRLLLGLIAVQWMSRRTARVVDAPWLPLAIELASELGITRRLTFVESRSATMPMAWGVVRPSVLMPADAVRWPVERLRIVLLHELAHVKRRDCLTHVVVQLACAAYWFNPLAWIAARRIRTERERACDDLVLAAGTHGPDYAEELLEIARVMRAGRFPSIIAGATLAMAHRSQLEGRLIAILDPKVPRSGISALRAALAATALACALFPLAALQPWSIAEAAAPAAVDEWQVPGPGLNAQARTAQPPNPQPGPQPHPAHETTGRAAHGPEADANKEAEHHEEKSEQSHAQAAEETIQAVQSATQGALQGAMQGAVQGVLQGAIHGAATAMAHEAQRAAADPRTVAALTAALKDSDKEVRETAMHALVQLRDPAVFEPLVQALKDTAQDVREEAARGLGQMRDKRAVEPLLAAMKDTVPGVREEVLRALAQLRDPRAIDAMIGALRDDNAGVREQAAFGLSQVRDPRAVDPLLAALKDSNAQVRQQAVFALSQIRDKRAAPALGALVKDPDPEVREQAVFALGQIRDASAIDGLVTALHDSKPDVREQAAFALGQIRDPRAVQPLISALKDENASVREQAAFALGQIRDRAAVEALVIAVKDSSPDVREQVVFALGQIRDPRAIDALTTALKDTSSDVRQQAAFALGQLARQ